MIPDHSFANSIARSHFLSARSFAKTRNLFDPGVTAIMATQEAKRPVHEIRLGRIKAAIWENATREGTRHNVSLTRIYKDGNTWKDSNSFGRDDLPLLAKVADLAHSWVYGNTSSPSSNVANSEEE